MVMMNSKAISLFSSTLLLLVLLPLLSCATSPSRMTKRNQPLSFSSISKDVTTSFKNHTHANDDDFDELLESAVKTYQHNYHLNATGTLDAQTVSKMMMPRCGVADIINGTNWMHSGKKRHDHRHGLFHTVSHYSFFQGMPKWSASQYHLTYGFLQGTPAEAIGPVARLSNMGS
ncbi:Metalloendoproteinase 1 [Morella rubra]|uniref:Metalloendoproteinase 1 n=1 Tax=Morella rubra TaxID=262757 RepID=A0A6A1W4N6_9ROSI|nr:Metalloendoproteinase 1 [Morella rubra]